MNIIIFFSCTSFLNLKYNYFLCSKLIETPPIFLNLQPIYFNRLFQEDEHDAFQR